MCETGLFYNMPTSVTSTTRDILFIWKLEHLSSYSFMQHASAACLQTSLCEQCGWCNAYLTQQEELVSTFLSVFITGALHLL